MRRYCVGVTGIQSVARNGGKRKQYARHPFRRFGDVGVLVDLTAVARSDQIARPEVGQIGDQPLHARACARREFLGLIHPQFHQQRAGIVVCGARAADTQSHLPIEALDLLEHRVRLGPVRVVEAHDRGAQQ